MQKEGILRDENAGKKHGTDSENFSPEPGGIYSAGGGH
jgi:hypothetical protein